MSLFPWLQGKGLFAQQTFRPVKAAYVMYFLILAFFFFVLLRGPGHGELGTAIHFAPWDQSLEKQWCCLETGWCEEGEKWDKQMGVPAFCLAPARHRVQSISIHQELMWIIIILDYDCLSVIEQPNTHWDTHIDFMRSYGQDGLQSKAVELWVSAHRPAFSLTSLVLSLCLNSFIFSKLLKPNACHVTWC